VCVVCVCGVCVCVCVCVCVQCVCVVCVCVSVAKGGNMSARKGMGKGVQKRHLPKPVSVVHAALATVW